MPLTPEKTFRWVRRLFLVLIAVLSVQLLAGIEVRRVDADDHSTPAAPAGSILVVRSVERDDGELRPEGLYFTVYEWPPDSGQPALRLVRLVGLPGEKVSIEGDRVLVGGREVSARPQDVLHWPEVIPAERVLVLTDEANVVPPRRLHPDSRSIGPIESGRLHMRVTAVLPF